MGDDVRLHHHCAVCGLNNYGLHAQLMHSHGQKEYFAVYINYMACKSVSIAVLAIGAFDLGIPSY